MLSAISLFVVRGPHPSSAVADQDALASQTTLADPLDQLSSAEIAVNASLATGLPEAGAVINQADSVAAEMAVTTADTTVVAKRQTVSTSFKSVKDIREYTVQEGDTLASIAARFNVTSDSIMWSNNLSSSRVNPGTVLVIPPVNGIVYTVQSGDTPESLAERYRANASQIIAFNDVELTGLKPGQRIVIPDGHPPAPAPSRSFRGSSVRAVWGPSNGYIYGFCTWHVANRRAEIGNPLPTNLGNAVTWYGIAAANGIPVGDQPRAGAVLWHRNTGIAGGLGHVGFVERVNPDGSILVSDMNYPVWGGVTTRTIPPSQFGQYRFIY
jgi:surface antigen